MNTSTVILGTIGVLGAYLIFKPKKTSAISPEKPIDKPIVEDGGGGISGGGGGGFGYLPMNPPPITSQPSTPTTPSFPKVNLTGLNLEPISTATVPVPTVRGEIAKPAITPKIDLTGLNLQPVSTTPTTPTITPQTTERTGIRNSANGYPYFF